MRPVDKRPEYEERIALRVLVQKQNVAVVARNLVASVKGHAVAKIK